MKRALILAAGGVLLFLVFAIAMWPAAVAYEWFAPPALKLYQADGTVWRGSAGAARIDGVDLGRVQWSANWSDILTLRPGWTINASRRDGAFADASVRLAGGDLQVRGLRAAMTLDALRQAGVMGNSRTGSRGNLTIDVARLDVAGGYPQLIDGKLVLQALTSPDIPDLVIGDFEVLFPGTEAAPLTGIIASLPGGPLTVEGSIELTGDGNYLVRGRLAPTDAATGQLRNGLRFLGTPDAEGFREFGLEGSF